MTVCTDILLSVLQCVCVCILRSVIWDELWLTDIPLKFYLQYADIEDIASLWCSVQYAMQYTPQLRKFIMGRQTNELSLQLHTNRAHYWLTCDNATLNGALVYYFPVISIAVCCSLLFSKQIVSRIGVAEILWHIVNGTSPDRTIVTVSQRITTPTTSCCYIRFVPSYSHSAMKLS